MGEREREHGCLPRTVHIKFVLFILINLKEVKSGIHIWDASIPSGI